MFQNSPIELLLLVSRLPQPRVHLLHLPVGHESGHDADCKAGDEATLSCFPGDVDDVSRIDDIHLSSSL